MITFPRPIITAGVMSQAFDPERVDYLSPAAGGRIASVTAGSPLWSMTLTYNNRMLPEAAELKAWLDSMRGSQRLMFAFDIDRQVPLYHQTGRPFAAAPASWAQVIADDGQAILTLTGLRPGQVVSIGDYVGFAWGEDSQCTTVRSLELVRVGADGVAAFAVEPPVPTLAVPGDATTTLLRAGCLMRVVTTDTKLAEVGLGSMPAGSKIVAVQDLIP